MLILASVLIFCTSAIFRLLDTSAGILISHGISVTPFYLSPEEIKYHMKKANDPVMDKKLKVTLTFQKLHRIFLVSSGVIFVLGIILEFVQPTFIYLI